MLNIVKTSWLDDQSFFIERDDYGEFLENLRWMLKCYLRQYKCMHIHNTHKEFHTYENHRQSTNIESECINSMVIPDCLELLPWKGMKIMSKEE